MRIYHFVLVMLVIIIWGFNFVVIKVGLKEMSPLVFCFLRFFLASVPAIFFLPRPTAPFKMIVAYGLIMFALQFSLLFIGIKVGMTAGLASLLLQVQVFFTILFATLFLGETPNKWQIIGALISFLGIGIVAINLGGNLSIIGFILIILAAACWGVSNIISKKIGKTNMVSLVVWGSFFAWPPLLLIAIMFDGLDSILNSFQHFSWLAVAAVAYNVYPATLFGYATWSWLMYRYSVLTIAPFTLLVPVFGMLSSFLVLNEPLQLWKILAAMLIISGLCINLLVPRLFINKYQGDAAVKA